MSLLRSARNDGARWKAERQSPCTIAGMCRFAAIVAVIVLTSGCNRDSSAQFRALSDEFVYTTLSFSPVAATGTGLHQYNNQNLDELLDDLSPAGLGRQRQFYDGFQNRIDALPAGSLNAEDNADLSIIRDQIALARLDLDEVQNGRHNPTLYVETLGNAFFSPYVL